MAKTFRSQPFVWPSVHFEARLRERRGDVQRTHRDCWAHLINGIIQILFRVTNPRPARMTEGERINGVAFNIRGYSPMTRHSRIARGLSAGFVAFGLVFSSAAFAQDKMSGDNMKKEDGMKHDGMKSGDGMKASEGMKHDAMKSGDGMKAGDGMKSGDAMKSGDSMKK